MCPDVQSPRGVRSGREMFPGPTAVRRPARVGESRVRTLWTEGPGAWPGPTADGLGRVAVCAVPAVAGTVLVTGGQADCPGAGRGVAVQSMGEVAAQADRVGRPVGQPGRVVIDVNRMRAHRQVDDRG